MNSLIKKHILFLFSNVTLNVTSSELTTYLGDHWMKTKMAATKQTVKPRKQL